MSFQRVRQLRVMKFLWLDSWIQRNVSPLSQLCTKANNVKKPVRYTSIKKAKPKTIIDIAKLLQQKAKETKEKKQSVITASALKAATSSTKPATPDKLNDRSDAKEMIISNAKIQTSASTLPAKDAVDSYSAPGTAIVDSPVNFAYSKDVDQMAMEGLHNKTYTEIMNAKDAAPQAVESAVESPTINAPQEATTQGEMTTNISQVFELSSANLSEVIPFYDDVASASEKHAGETSDGRVYMPDVMVTSKVMATPQVSSAHENSQEPFDVSEVVAVISASTFINIAQYSSQSQFTQSQDFLAPTWSSSVKADKPSSGQEIIDQAVGSFPEGTADSILDIASAEAVAVTSGEVPTLRDVCHEEAIQVFDPMPEVSSPQSIEDLPIVETTSVSLSKAVKVDPLSEMAGDAQRSISLKDPILVQTDVLEEEEQTEATEELTEAQLDSIQRLFLDKLREYSTKSQASGGPVDAGPEYENALSEELTKLQRLYGSGDLTKFPEFKFSEPVLDESSSK
ncbi:uncharacterized protein [Sinocyclocheilus grahami]|uniref:ATP synthase peripheral stalk subunit F6, mitochondrial n=1 Tax=Sinocyclocheilus grahami TaxID=75366 RepID=A0A672PWJ4_SINGR|nr:PREDICTED: uncharacterized protein LOC107603045 [Sinocyclocheilus grahami]